MSASRKGLNPEFDAKLQLFEKKLAANGIKVILTCGYRSIEEQNGLYAKGRTKPGKKVTNARGGSSWHNYGLAGDYAFVINGKVTWNGPWATFGKIARECGLEWGGDFKTILDRTSSGPGERRLLRCARSHRRRKYAKPGQFLCMGTCFCCRLE